MCSVCNECPRLCICDKLRDAYQRGEFRRRYPGVRYDVTGHEASTFQSERMHHHASFTDCNGYKSNITAWCPTHVHENSPSSGALTAGSIRTDRAGMAVLTDYDSSETLSTDAPAPDGIPVYRPVFPFSRIASAGFGPIHQFAGRGFDRPDNFVPSSMTVSPCFLEEKPLHYQAEIRRIYQRVRYFEACYSKGLTLENLSLIHI